MEPSMIIILLLLLTYSTLITFLLFVYEGVIRRQRTELSELYTMIYSESYRVLSEQRDENEGEWR